MDNFWMPGRRQFLRTVGVAAAGSMLSGCITGKSQGDSGFTKRVLSSEQVRYLNFTVDAPEGPSVLPNGEVAMVEFTKGNIVALNQAGNKRVLAHVGSGCAGTIMGDDNALYVAKSDLSSFMRAMGGGGAPVGDGPANPAPGQGADGPPPGGAGAAPQMAGDGTPAAIWRIDLASEKAEVLYDNENGEPLAGPNDLVRDVWGDLWVSQPTDSSVLNLRTDGSHIERVLTGVSGVNGITMSPDKKELYFMGNGNLMAYQVVGRGKLDPRGRVVLTWPSEFDGADGMKTQANGNILCGCRSHGVIEVTPQGKLVSQTAVEGQQVINMTFSPLQANVLLLALHPADTMTGGLAFIDWPEKGVL